jgi:glutaminyl-tRNA synthetase
MDTNTPASAKPLDNEPGTAAVERPRDFIREIVAEDCKTGKWDGRVVTRFPPEPNAYLHIGHAKAICIDFGIAVEFGGECHLRLDDTNPTKEETEYVDAIQEDIHWLGFDWGEHLYYASDYFPQMFDFAVQLIKAGKAYVCDLTPDEVREYRGTPTESGRESPHRNRSVEENLGQFDRMRKGEFPDGSKTLRAKIDMASGNINMRDPIMYRILHAEHHRQGDKWCIYPTYDWAHGLEDSIERVTHSLCSLEFQDHRPLYDWFLDALGAYHPRQYEFARLEVTRMLTSKRKMLQLVQQGLVSNWDDPRMPSLRGLRRRGYPPESIRSFCEKVGVAKSNSTVDIALLEHCVRDYLNKIAPRVMAVLRPLKVVVTNYPENVVEELDAVNNPENAEAGVRSVPFTREIYIEREDFMETPPSKFYRLAPGREVRLRYAYFIRCEEVVKDANGEVVELRCTYDPATRGGDSPDGRKVKATLHWVSASESAEAEVRLYDHLLKSAEEIEPNAEDWESQLNPNSLEVIANARIEPCLASAKVGERFQFERMGYFCVDTDSTDNKHVFNRIVTLKDEWSRVQKKG